MFVRYVGFGSQHLHETTLEIRIFLLVILHKNRYNILDCLFSSVYRENKCSKYIGIVEVWK